MCLLVNSIPLKMLSTLLVYIQKEVFLYVHNGLQHIDKALDDVENKGIKGQSADSINELMEIIRADVVAVSDKYNDLMISNLNVAKTVFEEI